MMKREEEVIYIGSSTDVDDDASDSDSSLDAAEGSSTKPKLHVDANVVKMDVDEDASSESICPSDDDVIEIIETPSHEPMHFKRKREANQNSTMVERVSAKGKVGAIFPSGGATRSPVTPITKSLKKKRARRVRVLHEIPELDRPGMNSRLPDFACHLRENLINFSRSDSTKPPERKSYATLDPPEVIDSQGNVNYFYELPRNSRQVLWWKRKVGTWLAQKVLKLDDAVASKRRYAIERFPDNYVLYQHRNGPKHDPRTDCYLETGGRARVRQFRSPEEFYEHAAWLIQKKDAKGRRAHCVCEYCRDRRAKMRKKQGVKQEPERVQSEEVENGS